MFGGHGKLLRINLSEGTVKQEEISEELFDKFLTGAGLATHYLFREVPKGADPLGPENELILMTGALTGTVAPSTGRFNWVFKSPLTGIWAQSNSAGFWGVDFKKTGYDGIIFQDGQMGIGRGHAGPQARRRPGQQFGAGDLAETF